MIYSTFIHNLRHLGYRIIHVPRDRVSEILPPHSAIFSKASSIMNVAVNTRGVFSVTAFGVQKVNAETSFKINFYPEIRHSLLK